MSKKNSIMIPVAPGELIDKITVLKIKKERISDPGRLLNIERELEMLVEIKEKHFPKENSFSQKISDLEAKLKKSNEDIWDMGDKIRELGEKQDSGEEFVKVAYGIHLANDRRASIKKEINLMLNSSIVEEKSYKHWR